MYAHELYEQNKPKIVVTYPGRFQPFHQGHAGVFAQLQKKFGRDSVYILTSNDTSSAKSPFNFSDKYQLMTAAGVPGDKIIETNQMYKLPDSIDATNTIFITAVGAPDADRLNPDTFTKRDQKDKDGNVTKPAGSPSYYKTWGGAETPMTADRHGYVIVIPEIHKEVTIKGKKYDVSHGTECRNLWNAIRNDANARAEFLSQMYARPSQELAAIFDKIPQATAEDVGADSQTSTSPIHGIKEQTQSEAFNRPYKTKSEKSEYGDVDMLAKLPDGTNLSIMFNHGVDNEWQVQFYRNNSQEVTGEGDAQRIFATVLNAIQKFIKKQKPQRLTFSASKEPEADMVSTGAHANPESRAKLYDRLVQRYAKALGYRAFRADNGKMVIYELSRINKDMAEGLDDEEFNPAPYVFSSIKHAEKEAARKGKKVVRSAGGYFKLANIDDPAPELIANPERDQSVAVLQNKVNSLKDFLKRIKRGTPEYDKFIERGGYGAVHKKIAAINSELARIPRFVQKNIASNNPQDVFESSNKQLKEGARPIGGIMTDMQARTVKDPATGGFIPADDFFAKYPDKNKQAWETALATALNPEKQKAANAAVQAAYNKEVNDLSWMTPEEQAQYKQLAAKDQAATQAGTRTYGAERYLKQLFQQKMDGKKAASMLKVHWAPLKQLESFLQGKVNNKIELSAYLAPNTESLGKTRWTSAYDPTVGIVLDGHITIGGRGDLGSDQYKMTAGQRGQQKYVSRPGQIDPTLSMDTSVHHEVLIDNWKIKEIVLPADIPPEVDRLVQQYKMPVRRLGNPQGVTEDAAGVGVVAKNKKMAKDPRYSMSITKDVKPSTPKNMLRAFRLSEDSAVSEEQVMSMVKSFLPLAMKELKLKKLPKIIIKKHIESHDGQATFGRFANEEECIYLGIADRHPVDILRTLAHELVHSKQHEQGRIEPNSGDTGSPIENEANAVAGVLMRYFNKKYPNAVKSSAVSLDESLIKRYQQFKENGDEADEVKKQKNLIPYPKGTVKVDVSDVYDWYKLGQEISDLDDADPADFGKGPPQTVMAFGSEPEEHRYLKDLKKLGLKTHDIDETYSGPALKFLRPGELRGSYTDKQLLALGFKQSQNGSWYIKKAVWDKLVSDKAIAENFADGKNPGRKGLAKRTGVPTKASVSKLRQIAKDSSGEKQRMAHWMANMKSGKAKAKK